MFQISSTANLIWWKLFFQKIWKLLLVNHQWSYFAFSVPPGSKIFEMKIDETPSFQIQDLYILNVNEFLIIVNIAENLFSLMKTFFRFMKRAFDIIVNKFTYIYTHQIHNLLFYKSVINHPTSKNGFRKFVFFLI